MRRYLQSIKSVKAFISRIRKELLQINKQKQDNPTEKMDKILEQLFHKREYSNAIKHMKNC